MRLIIILLMFSATGLVLYSLRPVETNQKKFLPANTSIPETEKQFDFKSARKFAIKNKLDTGLMLYIDYKMHSGLKRGFIVNLSSEIMFDSFMVSHGCGINQWGADQSRDRAMLSNNAESHCSSAGRYKIGKRAYSDWGINVKYFMHGLDSSNSNAYKRTIVLHSWDMVPDENIYPYGTPEGWGCPAVADKFMKKLDSTLISRKKAVLMIIN